MSIPHTAVLGGQEYLPILFIVISSALKIVPGILPYFKEKTLGKILMNLNPWPTFESACIIIL